MFTLIIIDSFFIVLFLYDLVTLSFDVSVNDVFSKDQDHFDNDLKYSKKKYVQNVTLQ